MTQTLRNLRAASKEFSAAVRWYEEQRPGLGGEFFDAVVQATALIQAQPEMARYHRIGERGVCWCNDFRIKSYIVFRQTRLSSSQSLT